MKLVEPLTFGQARQCVIAEVRAACFAPAAETVALEDACGRVLAEELRADRDYPPLARSIRDGFAVRAGDLPGSLEIVGEVRAGQRFTGAVGAGQTVEIMTGAPVPDGADAVVMVEHVTRENGRLRTTREVRAGDFIVQRGAEAARGQLLLERGRRLGFAEIALLASAGRARVDVFRRPRVAIVPTGDELVEVDESPLEHQVRNSNAHALAAQVRRAGGDPDILPVARDTRESTAPLVERGLSYDLLLLSGGVSAGRYDVVEPVLADLGATFSFDSVLIQPGRPLVFGRARGTFFFGLPGNPVSTMVTFEVFARAAVELMGGQCETDLPLALGRLSAPFRHKPGLTRFLPAVLGSSGGLTPLEWRGSSDMAATARGNAYLVADAATESWEAGELMPVLLR